MNLNVLDLPSLSVIWAIEIEAPFSRDEVKKIVMDMPLNCAPGKCLSELRSDTTN
jgi:hypothetical protein